MADAGRQQTWILYLWIAWEAVQGLAALFGLIVDSEGAIGSIQRRFAEMTSGVAVEVIVPFAFLAALALVTFGQNLFGGARSPKVGSDQDLRALEHFVSDCLFSAIDRLDGLISEATLHAAEAGDLGGMLLRDYILLQMRQRHNDARRALGKEASGSTADSAVRRTVLCEAVEAYRTASRATYKALESTDPATTHLAALYIRWKQADERTNQRLSELIGALPSRSVLRARLELIRLRYY